MPLLSDPETVSAPSGDNFGRTLLMWLTRLSHGIMDDAPLDAIAPLVRCVRCQHPAGIVSTVCRADKYGAIHRRIVCADCMLAYGLFLRYRLGFDVAGLCVFPENPISPNRVIRLPTTEPVVGNHVMVYLQTSDETWLEYG